MMIGGNKIATIEINTTTKNLIGEDVKVWVAAQAIYGWLDLQGGDSKHMTYSAKMQESTHVFVADYVELDEAITAENSRLIVDGKRYEVMLIDDPMDLHRQLEIYLKYTGGQ